jgi:uncharacterized membrane protein (DUF373 family)
LPDRFPDAASGHNYAMPDDGSGSARDASDTAVARLGARFLHSCEDVLYVAVALLLVGGAAVVLVDATYSLVTEMDDGTSRAIEHALDSLLIVFILIELLGAVRSTVRERRLVAEPFLLVGVIASIKEIVVLSAFAQENADIEDTVLQVGVLGGVVLGLSLALLLLRRKEREPTE